MNRKDGLIFTIKGIRDKIDARLNDHLCDMKPNYDDSITGFNEAWDIVRAIFKEELGEATT